jgi:transcription elongation factor Elf1
MDNLSKPELLQKCKDYNLKQTGNKPELKERIIQHEKFQKLPPFLQELSRETPVDVERRLCKACHAVGHNPYSKLCIVHGKQNREWIEYIKDYLLKKDKEDDAKNLVILSEQLDILLDHCTSLYRQIKSDALKNRKINIRKWLQLNPNIHCHECNHLIIMSQKNISRPWKGNQICQTCFSRTMKEREHTWVLIEAYRHYHCAICLKEKVNKDDCFHFDHLNMFDKGDTIYNMVTTGVPIEDIYKEIDKCQLLCFECHGIVTDLERETKFIKTKTKYTEDFINLPENETLKLSLQKKYEEIMFPLYEELKEVIREIRQTKLD